MSLMSFAMRSRERPSTAVTQPVGGATSPHTDRLRRRLAGDLDNIALKALSKEPDRRYASVDQFSEDVRRHLAGLPVIARKDTVGYRAAKFVRRNKGVVAAGAATLIVLIAGVVGTTWQARVASRERARAEQRFDDVRRLANAYLFELHDAIQRSAGLDRRAAAARRARPRVSRQARGGRWRSCGPAGRDRQRIRSPR